MSELDHIYEEFYAQVTVKIQSDYEKFQNEKAHLTEEALIGSFCKQLSKIVNNITTTLEPIEIAKTEYYVRFNRNPFRILLRDQFRFHRDNTYNSDPVNHFLNDYLGEITAEAYQRFMEHPEENEWENSIFILPKEELAKVLAAIEAYNDFEKNLYNSFQKQNQPKLSMSTKQTLRKWLADGENERVVEALQTIADQFGDKYFRSNVTSIAGRFNGIKRDRQNGVISDEFYNIQINQIRQALQDLIEDVPDNATLPDVALDTPIPTPLGNEGNGTPTQPQTPPSEDGNKQPADTNANIPWIIGLGLLILATLFAAVIPCPGESLSLASRILLSLGAAGIATILPGLFSIDVQGVKAGSAIGVFALVYLVNPAKAIEDSSACNKQPFDLTIFVESPSERIEWEAPAKLSLRLYNDPRTETIGENKTAIFKLIPAELEDSMAIVELIAAGWQFTNGSMRDTVTISKKSTIVQIERDNSRCCVSGFVEDESGKPAPQVTISILDIFTETDARGRFKLEIPKAKQRKDQSLKVYKQGYQSKTYPVQPETQQELEIQLEKVKK